DAAPLLVGMDHLDAVGVNVADTVSRLGALGRDDLDRAGLVHAEGPLGDVEVVSAPVGHHAAGVFAVEAPVREVTVDPARAEVRVVGPLRRRAEPAAPVEAR